jgi:hypothetical protein
MSKGHTWEPQEVETKGVRAFIDAGVETLTYIIKHPTKFGCVGWETWWRIDKYETQCNNPSPGAVRIYQPKC